MMRKLFPIILSLSLAGALFACGDDNTPPPDNNALSSGSLTGEMELPDRLVPPDRVTLPSDTNAHHFTIQITEADGHTPLLGARVAVDLATGDRMEQTTWLRGRADFGWLAPSAYPVRITVAKQGYVIKTSPLISRPEVLNLKGAPLPISMIHPGPSPDWTQISGNAYSTGSMINMLTVSPSTPGTTWQSLRTDWSLHAQTDTPFALVSTLTRWGDRTGLSDQGFAQEFMRWNITEVPALTPGARTFDIDIDFSDPFTTYTTDGAFALPSWMDYAQTRTVRGYAQVSSYASNMALFAGGPTRIDINKDRSGFDYTMEWVETKAVPFPVTRYMLELDNGFTYADVPSVPRTGIQDLDFMKPPALLNNPSLFAPIQWVAHHSSLDPYEARAMMAYVLGADGEIVWMTTTPVSTNPGEYVVGTTTFPQLPSGAAHEAFFSMDNSPYTMVMADCTWHWPAQGQCERAAGTYAPFGVWDVEVLRPNMVIDIEAHAERFQAYDTVTAQDCEAGDVTCWANVCNSHSECGPGMSCTEGRCMVDWPDQDDPAPAGPFFPIIP